MIEKWEEIFWRKETSMLPLLSIQAQLVGFLEDSFSLGCPVKCSWVYLYLYLYAPSMCVGKGVNLRFVAAGRVRVQSPVRWVTVFTPGKVLSGSSCLEPAVLDLFICLGHAGTSGNM